MGDKPDVSEVTKFDKGNLKKTEPQVKVHKPTKEDIEKEKEEQAAA